MEQNQIQIEQIDPIQDFSNWRIEQIRKNWKQEFEQAEREQQLKHSKSIANPEHHRAKRTFKNQIECDSTEQYYHKRQLNQNLQIITDTIAPPKPKHPQLEDYCKYCTDGQCEKCQICEQLEEQAEWEAKT